MFFSNALCNIDFYNIKNILLLTKKTTAYSSLYVVGNALSCGVTLVVRNYSQLQL